jgi:pilus assembly protein Flp/PilA
MRLIARFIQDQEAATSVEYSVMLALILMAVLAAVGTVGARTGGLWGEIVDSLNATDPP